MPFYEIEKYILLLFFLVLMLLTKKLLFIFFRYMPILFEIVRNFLFSIGVTDFLYKSIPEDEYSELRRLDWIMNFIVYPMGFACVIYIVLHIFFKI